MLAAASVCGMPVDSFVRADLVERALMERVTLRAAELQVKLMKDQAIHIANAVGQLFRRRG